MEIVNKGVLLLIVASFVTGTSGGVIRSKERRAQKKSNGSMNYYEFWKRVSKDLIPRTKLLMENVDTLMNDMCKCQKYNSIDMTEDRGCEDIAREKAKELKIPTSPERRILKIQDKDKFMKKLAKNTFKILSGYKDSLRSIRNAVCNQSTCLDDACNSVKSTIQLLDDFLKDMSSTMQGYFKFKIRPSRGRAIGQTEEQLAYVYGFLLELKETENALDFIVKITWDAYVPRVPEVYESEQKNTDLGLY